jgi:hypothetical protein
MTGHDVRAPHQRTWPQDKIKRMLFLAKEYQETSGKVDLITPEKEHSVSCSTIKERCERVQNNLKFNEDEINEVEKTTRGQANNSVWYNQRKYRITASKCYRIASVKPDTSPTKAIKEVLQYNPPCQFKCMKDGVEMESKILDDYNVLMHRSEGKQST